MTIPLSRRELLALRARNAGLSGDGFRGAELAVAGLAAVPATSPVPALALLPRVRSFRYADLEDASDEERALVRVTSLRGEPMLVHRALAASFLDATESPRRAATFALAKHLGMGTPVLDILRGHIVETLHANGPSTPGELSRILERKIPEGETLNRLLALLCAEGTLVRATNKGDWQRNAYTYALLMDWVPEAAQPGDTAQAVRALADAYVRAYGPCGPEDFSHWSGIPLQDAAPAFAELTGEFFESEGRTLLGYAVHLRRLKEGLPEAPAAVLPFNDPLLLAHAPPHGPIPAEAVPLVHDAQGNAASVVLVDGEAVALWTAKPAKRRLGVRVAPFPGAPSDLLARLEPALQPLAEFLNVPEVNVEPVPLPPPLAERPPWAYQLPLQGLTGPN